MKLLITPKVCLRRQVSVYPQTIAYKANFLKHEFRWPSFPDLDLTNPKLRFKPVEAHHLYVRKKFGGHPAVTPPAKAARK